MTTTLRPYQAKAVDDISSSLRSHSRVLGWFPTASGKSAIVAEICKRFLAKSPSGRVLVLCHTSEIIEQNEAWCRRLGVSDVGIYCAGVKRKDSGKRVIHASRDSLGNNPLACGLFDIVIFDECHLVGSKEGTRYQKILSAINPRWSIGLTGTPWRLDNGVVYGKDKPFEVCAARIEMQDLFDAGYLCPYTIPAMPQIIDTAGIKKTGGDFNIAQLEARSATHETVRACLDEWQYHARGRRLTLIFCCSIAHANVVHEQMKARGHHGAILTGETPKAERDAIMERARNGRYAYVANVAVLTTGVDIPRVDCILFLRATTSLSLWVQMLGRGLRLHPDKQDCLMLDASGNFLRLGRPEAPLVPKERGKRKKWTDEELLAMGIDPEEMKGEAAMKTCPKCKRVLPAAAKSCYSCGHLFINHESAVLTQGIAIPGVEDNSKWAEYAVDKVTLDYGLSSAGKPRTKATFLTACGKTITEYIPHKVENRWAQDEIEVKLKRIKGHVSKIRARQVDGWWRTKVLA